MDNVIKSFLTIFCILMFFFVVSGVVYSAISARNADGYAKACAQEISECDFSEDVCVKLKNAALADGYYHEEADGSRSTGLTIEPVDVDNDRITDMAFVTLEYTLKVPFFNYKKTHYIKQIAR